MSLMYFKDCALCIFIVESAHSSLHVLPKLMRYMSYSVAGCKLPRLLESLWENVFIVRITYRRKDFNWPWSVFNVFKLFSNYKIHTEIFLTVFWLAVLEVSSGFQLVKLGERGGHRRDFHDSEVNTRHAMEHVRESKTGLSSLAIDNY